MYNVIKENKSPYYGRVFRMLFGMDKSKKNIVSLCSAIDDKSYCSDDVKDVVVDGPFIIVNMKDNMIYAFDQITGNDALTLGNRALYIHSRYSNAERECRYICLYNGEHDRFDKYSMVTDPKDDDKQHTFYTVININKGQENGICEACHPLTEYMTLVETIREIKKRNLLAGEIADLVIDRCLKNHVLEDFLNDNRVEIKEYLRIQIELYQLAQESYDEGVKDQRNKCIDGLSETLGCSWDKSKELLRIN